MSKTKSSFRKLLIICVSTGLAFMQVYYLRQNEVDRIWWCIFLIGWSVFFGAETLRKWAERIASDIEKGNN